MIWLNPRRVTIGAESLDYVSSVVVDRRGERVVVEFSDEGPHVAFADIPEQRVVLRLERTVVSGGTGGLAPGDAGELSFVTAPTASTGVERRVTASVVVTNVTHTVDSKRGGRQVIECVAVSSDGSSDPISDVPVAG